MTEIAQTRIKADQFLQLPETNVPTELIDGEVIMAPSPTVNHQRFVSRIERTIARLATTGEVFFAPLDVYLDEDNVVQPDVLWVGPESACTVGEDYLQGPPDLIVEVLSAGTARRDRREKFALYEQHGVREYWMIDPEAEFVEVWQLKDRRFDRLGVFGPGEAFVSAALGGKTVDLSLIFER